MRSFHKWKQIFDRLLVTLVNDSGTWTSKSLKSLEEQGVILTKRSIVLKGLNIGLRCFFFDTKQDGRIGHVAIWEMGN